MRGALVIVGGLMMSAYGVMQSSRPALRVVSVLFAGATVFAAIEIVSLRVEVSKDFIRRRSVFFRVQLETSANVRVSVSEGVAPLFSGLGDLLTVRTESGALTVPLFWFNDRRRTRLIDAVRKSSQESSA